MEPSSPHLPALFVSHGMPTVALHEDDYSFSLREFGRQIQSRCKGIVVMSSHWSTGPIQITGAEKPPILHDFKGFQKDLYELDYPAPGEPELARSICERLEKNNLPCLVNTQRGFDHGVWIPLRFIRPEADLPVVQLSIPMALGAREILAIGRLMRPLREQGYLILGSGGAANNLERLIWHERNFPADPRSQNFENWLKQRLQQADVEDLINFTNAPDLAFAHPTHEHLMPLFFVMGSSISGDSLQFLHEGMQYRTISMLSFALATEHLQVRALQ
jgi:4,5-DOPA dioxygenase extradiol